MKLKIKYVDSAESFGMSGPWLGKLQVDEQELLDTFLDANFVSTEDEKLYAFNQYHPNDGVERFFFGLFKTKTWKRKFRIIAFDSINHTWMVSKNSWDSLFLTRISRNTIYFTNAFHDDDRKMFPEHSIILSNENFSEINKVEIVKL